MTIEPEPLVAWATDCRDKYASKSDNPQDKTWPGNHDSGYAGRICMADGNLAWAAVVSDGAGGSEEGLKISAVAIQAFTAAVAKSSLAELTDHAARDAWLRAWTKSLHADVWARFKGGYATFCGAVILPPASAGRPGEPPSVNAPGWKLVSFNVGDSQIMKLTGDGKCMGIVPDAPPNNANVEGHNPIRVVGKEPKGDFCLLDVEEFPLPAEGPCWILAGSDGFFSKKKGKNELAIYSAADMRETCMVPGVPFHEMPGRALARCLANARKLDAAEMMDNATVAMLGFRIPATDLRGAATTGAAPAAASRPAEPPKAAASVPDVDKARTEAVSNAAGGRPALHKPAPRGGVAETNRAKTAITAAIALVFGIAIGLLAFGGRGRSSAVGDDADGASSSARQAAAASPYPALVGGFDIADNVGGRCEYCLELRKRGELPDGETPFHWAEDCPHRNGVAGRGE